MRRVTRRFAEVVCPPGMRAHHRTDRVLAEFELMLAALAPAARKALTAAVVVLDHGARLYPRARGRRFTRLDDQAAEAYIRALLARGGVAAQLVQRLRGLVVMCYYELPRSARDRLRPGPVHRGGVPPAAGVLRPADRRGRGGGHAKEEP